ncbi:L-serine ammonia-lyase [Sandarakinorhabdus sp.]|uniref:L-serine ammonia-lyase n=1 Tax=Sandarakinorhabdus sp. TaxID=1916663 RepID=UPI00334219E8
MLSVLDMFRVGVGPSSSHTVGPMRIGGRVRRSLAAQDWPAGARLVVTLQGSLAFTGHGHGTLRAAALGLLGHEPETIDMAAAELDLAALHSGGRLQVEGRTVHFAPDADIRLDYDTRDLLHPNAMQVVVVHGDAVLLAQDWYSTGGGFIASRRQLEQAADDDRVSAGAAVPHPFGSAADLLEVAQRLGLAFDAIILANEAAMRPPELTLLGLDRIAAVMMACIDRGLTTSGILPGGLKVERRAPQLWRQVQDGRSRNEPERLFDLLNVYAMAVNEENAAGGQVVTAPTNGAAGIIPAVMRHYCETTAQQRRFLLTAGAIGLLYKQRASISGAEMGCQGEVGVACSMAAAGLAAIWNASPQQVANAAEIGMEHNLGLTCDPVGGLVQIPCIERNAIGAVKAANAARLALHRPGQGRVTLDEVIETMRQTGVDMSHKYKETSQGGLAVNVVEC